VGVVADLELIRGGQHSTRAGLLGGPRQDGRQGVGADPGGRVFIHDFD